MGWLTQRQGDTGRAEAAYEEMLKLSRELGDKGNIATALNSLGTLAAARGDNERSAALVEENLAVLRKLEEEGNAATTPRDTTHSTSWQLWRSMTRTTFEGRRCCSKVWRWPGE
jgi:hypothetical protein